MGINKFGWSLPPGCSSSDIPGNRREDIEHEILVNNIEEALAPIERSETHEEVEAFEQATENLIKLINKAFEDGYAQCQNDVDEARSYAALEHCDDARLDDRQQENEQRIQSEETL